MLLIYQFIINADYLKDPNVENAENQVYIKKRIKWMKALIDNLSKENWAKS